MAKRVYVVSGKNLRPLARTWEKENIG